MFGLQIVDVALGLVFIYLTLALACTAINETIATMLAMRSRTLQAGICHLLRDPHFKHPDGLARSLEARFYDHPLITSLFEGQRAIAGAAPTHRSRPSYIPGPIFAAVVLDIVAPAMENSARTMADIRQRVAALPESSELRRTLLVLMDEAGDDVARLHRGVEAWFNQAMERVSGWYKRRLHWLTLLCGVSLTVFINADTIQIAHVLANDPKELTGLLHQAEQYYAQQQANRAVQPLLPGNAQADTVRAPAGPSAPRIDTEHLNATIADLHKTGVPLGWHVAQLPVAWHGDVNEHWFVWLARKLAGLLVTAMAVSMGAPFWFDILGKVMTVRGVGDRPPARGTVDANSPERS